MAKPHAQANTVGRDELRYAMAMRYLSIDLGGKRTGLAIGSDVLGVATPLSVVEGQDDDARLHGIAEAIDEHAPDALVLGLPLNMDDSEGDAAQNTRRFARLLAERFGLQVHLVDERLSSFEADASTKGQTGKQRRKAPAQDAVAAKLILERFLQKS